jgi:hypothetical protein
MSYGGLGCKQALDSALTFCCQLPPFAIALSLSRLRSLPLRSPFIHHSVLSVWCESFH